MTVDLTKITTPFGLLDKETQAALKAHGGQYEVFSEQGWVETDWPAWGTYLSYRVKPAPPKPREWWAVGQHLRDTEEEAEAFLARLRNDHPGDFTDWRVIPVIEKLPK